VVQFLRIDHAIVVGIECAEKAGHGSLPTRAVWAWAAFATGAVVILRGARRGRRRTVLGAERPARQGEGHRGGEDMSGIHRRR
jgi:hypothetical protein